MTAITGPIQSSNVGTNYNYWDSITDLRALFGSNPQLQIWIHVDGEWYYIAVDDKDPTKLAVYKADGTKASDDMQDIDNLLGKAFGNGNSSRFYQIRKKIPDMIASGSNHVVIKSKSADPVLLPLGYYTSDKVVITSKHAATTLVKKEFAEMTLDELKESLTKHKEEILGNLELLSKFVAAYAEKATSEEALALIKGGIKEGEAVDSKVTTAILGLKNKEALTALADKLMGSDEGKAKLIELASDSSTPPIARGVFIVVIAAKDPAKASEIITEKPQLLKPLDPDTLTALAGNLTADQLMALLSLSNLSDNAKAPFLAALVEKAEADALYAYLSDNPEILEHASGETNVAVKAKVGDQARSFVLADPTDPKTKQLAPYAMLEAGEQILSFSDSGTEYVIIVKPNAGGDGFDISSSTPSQYYIESSEGALSVRKQKGRRPNPKRDATFTPTAITTATSTRTRTRGSTPPAPGGYQTMTTSNGLLTIYWRDTDNDGKIDKDELEGAQIVVKNASDKELSVQLYNVIERNMNASAQVDADTALELTLGELEEAEAVIAAYADELGMTFKDAAEAYRTASSFRNVDFEALSSTKTDINGWLTEIDFSASSAEVEAAVRAALENHLEERIVNNVILYLERTSADNADELAAYILRCSMASMTGNYELFGIKEKEKENLEALQSFTPKRVTRGNLLDWLATGEVDEEGGVSGGGTGTRTRSKAVKDAVKEVKDADDATRKESIAFDRLQSFVEKGEIEAAEDFVAAVSGRHIDGFDQDKRVAETLVNGYLGSEDPEQYDKALELLQGLPKTQKRDELLAKLALAYLKLDDQSQRENARAAAASMESSNIPWGQDGRQTAMTADRIRLEVENALWVHADLYNLEQDYFVDDQQTGEPQLIEGKETELARAEEILRGVIESDDPQYKPQDKAYARILLARILTTKADGIANIEQKQAVYVKAMKELRIAWNIYSGLRAAEPDNLRYKQGKQDSFEGMARLVNHVRGQYGVNHYPPQAKELAKYIPKDTSKDALVSGLRYFPEKTDTWDGDREAKIDPNGFRKQMFVGRSADLGSDLGTGDITISTSTAGRTGGTTTPKGDQKTHLDEGTLDVDGTSPGGDPLVAASNNFENLLRTSNE